MELYGGIEAGGTKFNCIAGTGPDDIQAEIRIPTTTPDETIGQVIDFYRECQRKSGMPISALGVACFGPVDLDLNSPTWGYITSTPKPGWADTDVASAIGKALRIPVAFETDTNGAAIGEGMWGAAQNLSDYIYITIGTGIGGGGMVYGRPVHGLVHSEMGHMRLPRDPVIDPFPGSCPYHGDCFEGLANGPAMQARWGQPAETLPPDHPAWDLEAHYIATALHNLICAYSPQLIILGGGVMQQHQLFPLIREKTVRSLNRYVRSPLILDRIEEYIVAPGLGTRSGVLGALAMAREL